jgi:hypothetical protein
MEKEEVDEKDTASILDNSRGCWLSSSEKRIFVFTSAKETHTLSDSTRGSGNAESGGRTGKAGTANGTESSATEK